MQGLHVIHVRIVAFEIVAKIGGMSCQIKMDLGFASLKIFLVDTGRESIARFCSRMTSIQFITKHNPNYKT